MVVTRKPEEGVVIEHNGEQIRLGIVAIEGSKAKLWFDVPQSFVVLRDELVRRREAERD